MEYEQFDFRHAAEILSHRAEWASLDEVIRAISDSEIVAAHEEIAKRAGRAPAGGQSAINEIFRQRLAPLGWQSEPRLFPGKDEALHRWKMDFIRARVGVEVSFNHAEAVPWTFTRLNLAGESEHVMQESKIDVGVALFATDALKKWARMDGAVGTYELARSWLKLMRPIMPIPVLVIGLAPDHWPASEAFRGTTLRGKGRIVP